MNDTTRSVDLTRMAGGRLDPARDRVAVEAGLEVRLNGHPFAVIMRTPGDDTNLAAGFLLSEGVLRSSADLDRIDATDTADTLNVVLGRGRAEILPDILSTRRNVAQNSSCGLCGRRTLASLDVDRAPLAIGWQIDGHRIAGFPDALRRSQHAFAETGGLHAAGLFDLDGVLQLSAEDVGRHNAVDKLLGRSLIANRLPLSRAALLVSGRASFEIVQKAFVGGIPLVAAVSAPSSLAVDLAQKGGITLIGFVRGNRLNVYTHPARVNASAHSRSLE